MSEWYDNMTINTDLSYNDAYSPAPIFPSPSFEADGTTQWDVPAMSRSNTSFWNFDQSQVSKTLSDVIGSSVGQAAAKTGLQLASDSINKNANQPGLLGQFANNFRSTSTGQQINAGAYASQFQNFLANPVVWLAVIVGVVLIFVLRK